MGCIEVWAETYGRPLPVDTTERSCEYDVCETGPDEDTRTRGRMVPAYTVAVHPLAIIIVFPFMYNEAYLSSTLRI